jgi:hypothetical protein
MVRPMTIRSLSLALLLCALSDPLAAQEVRTPGQPRLSGELRFGMGRLPDPDTGSPRTSAIAGARIALGIETQPDNGPRLGLLVEIEASGPSGPWRN